MTAKRLRYRYYNSCYRKLRHPHSGTALAHVTRLRKEQPDRFFQIYYCDYCGGLHIGHRPSGWRELQETDIFEEETNVGYPDAEEAERNCHQPVQPEIP